MQFLIVYKKGKTLKLHDDTFSYAEDAEEFLDSLKVDHAFVIPQCLCDEMEKHDIDEITYK